MRALNVIEQTSLSSSNAQVNKLLNSIAVIMPNF